MKELIQLLLALGTSRLCKDGKKETLIIILKVQLRSAYLIFK